MPLYEYRCPNKNCEMDVFEQFNTIENRKKARCPLCKWKGSLKISKSRFKIDFREGFDPGLGEYVSTKRQREELIAANNLRRIKD